MRIKWKRTISFLFAFALCGCAAGAGNPDNVASYVHTAAIKVSGENQYKAVRLTPQVYNAANGDLSDLLVKDGKGETVPYFINTSSQSAYSHNAAYPMTLINSYVKDDSFYFDYKLTAAQSGDVVSTSIEFMSGNTNFAKEVEVYGSYDNIHWEYVQNDKIYSIDGISKQAIEFIKPQKFTHYRLKLANNLEQISFYAVNLIYSEETVEETYFIESFEPSFKIEGGDKNTKIFIGGMKNLRLCDITVHTDSMFKRVVNTPHSIYKEIFNLSINGITYTDTAIPMNRSIPQDATYDIAIDDGDDKPIAVAGITVRYYADEVVFEAAAGGDYILEFSGDSAIAAPVYDIERYKGEVLKSEIDRAELGEIRLAMAVKPPERDYRMVFNIVIVFVVLLLGAIFLLNLRKKQA